MFLLQSKSRYQFREDRLGPVFEKNIRILSQTNEGIVADPDTLAYYFEKQSHFNIRHLPSVMVKTLIRKKVLDPYRLFGAFLIAIDGTGLFTFNKRHCEHCLTKKLSNGTVIYQHQVLEAKLVTSNGFAFSIASLFVDNPNEFVDKQDCELKAFYRLAPLIKEYFPRTPLCFLLDGLYNGNPIFNICEENDWKFIMNFKEGSMPALYKEANTIVDLSTSNRRYEKVNFTTNPSKAIFCEKTENEDTTKFEYLTNIKTNYDTVEAIINKGGRLRWKIENQGFKSQKKEGFELEHVYSHNYNAMKNFYCILQITHIIYQLVVKGSLLGDVYKVMGSLRNFVRRLTEHFRMLEINPDIIQSQYQIRFNTS